MSDVGIFSGPFDMLFLVALLGGPGFVIGAILGVLLWRGHRIAGLLIGAAVGGALCFAGWAWLNDVI
jgi:hypothetical protein